MKEFFKKHSLKITGVIVGGVNGFAYYHFVGCASGICPITSNAYMTIFYGAFMGYLLFDMFKKKEHRTS